MLGSKKLERGKFPSINLFMNVLARCWWVRLVRSSLQVCLCGILLKAFCWVMWPQGCVPTSCILWGVLASSPGEGSTHLQGPCLPGCVGFLGQRGPQQHRPVWLATWQCVFSLMFSQQRSIHPNPLLPSFLSNFLLRPSFPSIFPVGLSLWERDTHIITPGAVMCECKYPRTNPGYPHPLPSMAHTLSVLHSSPGSCPSPPSSQTDLDIHFDKCLVFIFTSCLRSWNLVSVLRVTVCSRKSSSCQKSTCETVASVEAVGKDRISQIWSL